MRLRYTLQVVFTERIRPFRRMKRDYSLFNEDYHIAFENEYIQEAFENLLLFVCKKCHNKPFSSFESLTEHMRRIHDLYSCDLCVDNLKVCRFVSSCVVKLVFDSIRIRCN